MPTPEQITDNDINRLFSEWRDVMRRRGLLNGGDEGIARRAFKGACQQLLSLLTGTGNEDLIDTGAVQECTCEKCGKIFQGKRWNARFCGLGRCQREG